LKFSCPKCKYTVMYISNTKEVLIMEFKDASHLYDIYEYGDDDEWLGVCNQCGYRFEAKTLTELIENLETVGAVK
jgi:transcription initiation factor IIE alpha subunit